MSGFIASNNLEMLSGASKIFTQQGMLFKDIVVSDNLVIRCFSKINCLHIHIYEQNGITCFVAGSFQYKGKVSQEALELILKDYANGALEYTNIRGSWNLILVNKNDSALVVTSPSGQFFSFFYQSGGNYLISSSFLACCLTLKGDIELNHLQALDYICNDAIHSDETYIKGINLVPINSVCTLNDTKINLSMYSTTAPTSDSCDEYINSLTENWSEAFQSMASNGGLKIDISGGLDSRLIAALMKKCGVFHTYNVNYSSNTLSKDVELATYIAQQEERELQIIEYPSVKKEVEWNDLRSSFLAYDGLRSVLGKASVGDYIFRQKAIDCEHLVGGHGGELLREFWLSLPFKTSLSKFLECNYTISGISRFNRDLVLYFYEFASPILSGVQYLDSSHLSRFYYRVRMRYWAGARISVLNKYVNKFSPMNDFHQAETAIAIDSRLKRHAIAEKQIIKGLSPKIFSYPSQYGMLKVEPTVSDRINRANKVFKESIKMYSNIVSKPVLDLNDICKLCPQDMDLGETLNEIIEQCGILTIIKTKQVPSNIIFLALVLTVLRSPEKYLLGDTQQVI